MNANEGDKENPQVHVYTGGVVVADAAGTTTITSDGKIINSDGTTQIKEDVLSEKKKEEFGDGPDEMYKKKKKDGELNEDDPE